MAPNKKYDERSGVETTADTYVPLSKFPTLKFDAPKRRRGPLLLALLLFAAGSAAAYFSQRAPILAAPTCDQRVMECGR